ncbi:hypothetical protein AVEN_137817-1 [Araneus ventricosus]|uniref:Uncharacterized protein n=1 Tax=Araneus ventricosus TaxID=182803 RepID=A0A4Y2DBD9_ARAVE|nr:hypothetical protein AVEN_94396-1 [Araneus ventricosus]GBM13427.1 hypothetical protein AVEN_137817-1 [Araneus ventricosus]
MRSPEPLPYSPDSALNPGSKPLSGTRFSSKTDVKTVVENWFNGQDVISANRVKQDFVQRTAMSLMAKTNTCYSDGRPKSSAQLPGFIRLLWALAETHQRWNPWRHLSHNSVSVLQFEL